MKFTKAKLAKTVAVILCSAIIFCGCTKNSDVVIKVNDHEITRSQYWDDFNKIKNIRLQNVPKEYRKDTSYPVLSLKQEYSNDIIIRELISQEFDKREIKVTQEELDAKKKEMIEQIGSEEQFKKILKENNISDEKLRQDMEIEVKMEKLVKNLNIKDATDSEAQAFYNKNKAQFNLPERVLVSHILIETNPEVIKRNIADADKNASLSKDEIEKKAKEEISRKEALAKEVLDKAKANPKEFAKLAQEYSEDKVSAQKGGDLGYITRDLVVKEFGDAAFSQKINEVGPLVKTQFGEHIILVKDKAAKGTQSFKEVKNDLKAYLTQQKKIEAIQKFVTGLRDNAKIEFIDESLDPKNIEKQLTQVLQKEVEKQKLMENKKINNKQLEKTDK